MLGESLLFSNGEQGPLDDETVPDSCKYTKVPQYSRAENVNTKLSVKSYALNLIMSLQHLNRKNSKLMCWASTIYVALERVRRTNVYVCPPRTRINAEVMFIGYYYYISACV